MKIGKSWYGDEEIGLRVRVRYLWDTVKKLDWTCAHNSIDLKALIDLIVFDNGKKKLRRIQKYIDSYGHKLRIRSIAKVNE